MATFTFSVIFLFKIIVKFPSADISNQRESWTYLRDNHIWDHIQHDLGCWPPSNTGRNHHPTMEHGVEERTVVLVLPSTSYVTLLHLFPHLQPQSSNLWNGSVELDSLNLAQLEKSIERNESVSQGVRVGVQRQWWPSWFSYFWALLL